MVAWSLAGTLVQLNAEMPIPRCTYTYWGESSKPHWWSITAHAPLLAGDRKPRNIGVSGLVLMQIRKCLGDCKPHNWVLLPLFRINSISIKGGLLYWQCNGGGNQLDCAETLMYIKVCLWSDMINCFYFSRGRNQCFCIFKHWSCLVWEHFLLISINSFQCHNELLGDGCRFLSLKKTQRFIFPLQFSFWLWLLATRDGLLHPVL